MCSCELHDSSTALAQCSCICMEHDHFFDQGLVVLRKALRAQGASMYRIQQDVGMLMRRYTNPDFVKEISAQVDQAHEAIGSYSKDLVGIYSRLRGIEDELKRVNERLSPPEKEAAFPLAEDQEPLPDVNEYKDVEPCPKCGHYRDTPNHELGCEPEESDGELLARLGTDAAKWAEEFIGTESELERLADIHEALVTWFANAIEAGRNENGVALDYLAYLAGRNYREKATEWFENYYGTEAFEPVGPEGLIGQWSEKLAAALRERDEARRDVARLTSELNLAKNTAPEPVTEDDSGWTMIPLDSFLDPARKIRLTIVGPAGEGWDGSLATDYRWDNDHDVTLEILGGPKTLTGVVAPPPKMRNPRKICYAPLAPMAVGSTCTDCGHHSLVHSDDGPCVLCAMEAKFA